MNTTATYDVMYVGQLRFVECVTLHDSLLKNAKNIYGVFVKDLIDSWNVNLGASYSCNRNIAFNAAVEYFKKSTGTLDVTVVDSKKYNEFIDTTTLAYFKAQRFLMMADFIKNTDSDFVFVISTDLILNTSFINDPSFFDYFSKLESEVFVKNNLDPTILRTHLIIFNSKGVSQLKSTWQDSYRRFVSEGKLHLERVETTWETLLIYSGVQIRNMEYQIQETPFRSTMRFDEVKKINFDYIGKKDNEWREYKNSALKKVGYRPLTFLTIPFNETETQETYESNK
jgi:hypothetical protein